MKDCSSPRNVNWEFILRISPGQKDHVAPALIDQHRTRPASHYEPKGRKGSMLVHFASPIPPEKQSAIRRAIARVEAENNFNAAPYIAGPSWFVTETRLAGGKRELIAIRIGEDIVVMASTAEELVQNLEETW